MSASLRHSLRIVVVLAYIPLVLSLGMLHTDELISKGNGHVGVRALHVATTTGASDAGTCLACVFAAGHIFEQASPAPGIAQCRFALFSPLSEAPPALRRASTARAPPPTPLP